jgi:hypothetical protein
MSASLRPLSSDEIAARDAGLDLAAQLISAPRPLRIDQVQALYDTLLAGRDDGGILIAVSFAQNPVSAVAPG